MAGTGTMREQEPKLFPIFSKNFRPQNPDPLQEIQTTLDKLQHNQQTKRKKCMLGKKETAGLTQLVLDAGQKVIGPVHCEECGLLYSPGDIEDEKEHQKAHARLDNLFCLRLWKNANVIGDYPAEACSIVMVDCKTESKRVLNTLEGLLTWLDSELAAAFEVSGSKSTDKIFLYLFRTRRKSIYRVLGCVIVENIMLDHIISSPLDSNNCMNKENKPLLLGITRLWTDAAFRRKRIASRMCDSIRFNYGIPGFIVPKDQLGILEPSEDGKAFMTTYTGNKGSLYTYTMF